MKCPQCGYFNIPGVETCGQCRAALTAAPSSAATGAAPVPFEELYPPRARDRKPADRLRTPLRRSTRRLRPLADRVRDASSVSPDRYDLRPWGIASAAVLPGAGQLLQGRPARAAQLFGAFAALVCAAVLLLRSPLSDLLFWAILGLSVYSVRDAAEHSFPTVSGPDSTGALKRLRSLRLLVLSVAIVAGTVYGVGLTLGRWYDLWVFQTDQAAPVFRRGDGLIVRRLTHPERQLHRGDVAVYFEARPFLEAPRTERIVGVPGDTVSSRGDTLLVNGKPVPPDRLPLTFETPLPPLSVTVPPGTVCLWRGVGARNGAETVPAPYVLMPAGRIQGRAIGLYRPAARRRWF